MIAAATLLPAAMSGDVSPVSAAAISPVQACAARLFLSYSQKSALIGGTWWQGAVALSTLETYQQATGDAEYSSAIRAAFTRNRSGDFENQADDDTSWWGLAWLQAYDLTHARQYLSMAETDADYVHEDWDSACGGGIWWQRNPPAYKNAISNELFLELTAWLHNSIRGDTKYLNWAETEWAWFRGSGLINSSDLVNDGLTNGCQNNHQTTWTYNQGVILAGLAQLYLATGDVSLLAEGERIASSAIRHLTAGGVLQEPCTGPGCASDADEDRASFKGIFVRDLKILAVTAGTSQFNSFFRKQAQAIESHDTGSTGLSGALWTGPPSDPTSYSQASAEDALVAALGLPGQTPP